MKINTPLQSQRKRKMLLMLPLLVLPFWILAFKSLGGGGSENIISSGEGLNANLPSVIRKEAVIDKLALYRQAEKDSLDWQEQLGRDPYFQSDASQGHAQRATDDPDPFWKGSQHPEINPQHQEEKIYERLEELSKVIHPVQPHRPVPEAPVSLSSVSLDSKEVDRLEAMMDMVSPDTDAVDPEMEQINKTLQAIADIQHPELVRQRIAERSRQQRGKVFRVDPIDKGAAINILQKAGTAEEGPPAQDGFYGLDSHKGTALQGRTIMVAVHQDQIIYQGGRVKLRLLQDIAIDGHIIPTGTLVYGLSGIRGERMEIELQGISSKGEIYEVSLKVYDLDGMSGIRIPASLARDALKKDGSRSLPGLSGGMMDASVGAQVASAGLEISRNLMTKKIKQVKIKLKAGYQLMLLND